MPKSYKSTQPKVWLLRFNLECRVYELFMVLVSPPIKKNIGFLIWRHYETQTLEENLFVNCSNAHSMI